MKAVDLDFSKERFKPSEWPSGSLEWLDAKVVQTIFDIRNRLPSDHLMIPSPLLGGHVRHEVSGSQHSTLGGTRLSTATDIFMSWEHVHMAIVEAYRHPLVGGLGIYTDNMLKGERGDYAMLHIDIRPKSEFVQWIGWRTPGQKSLTYTYFNKEPKKFLDILSQRGKLFD